VVLSCVKRGSLQTSESAGKTAAAGRARPEVEIWLAAMTSTETSPAGQRAAFTDPIAKVSLWTLLPLVLVASVIALAITGQEASEELENKAQALGVALSIIAWWRWAVLDVTRRAGFVSPAPGVGTVLKPAAEVALAGILTTLAWLVLEHLLRLPIIGLVEAPTLVRTKSGSEIVVLSVLVVVVVAPAAEELFFRGALFRKWRLRWGAGKIALATSVLFALGHSRFVTTCLFALALAVLYTTTRTIWAPVIAHMLNNLFPAALTIALPLIPREALAAAADWPLQLAALVPGLAGAFWLVRFIRRGWHTLSHPVDGVTERADVVPSSISSE
jgi:membrane protease YdiL (CAAX protease family)